MARATPHRRYDALLNDRFQRFLLPPRTEPRMPRSICRPSSEPIERAALFANASTMPCDWRPPRGPVLPKRKSDIGFELRAGSAAFAAVRPLSFSYADSRSIGVSYLPATGERRTRSARSPSVIGPSWLAGGTT